MHLSIGHSPHTWQPDTTVKTNDLHYWWNWRFLLCAIWVLSAMIVASILIWKYEGSKEESQERAEASQEAVGALYQDESWMPCLKEVHPAWLLAFRVIAFFILLTLLILNGVANGGIIFYYYTQCTFLLVTVFFALGSVLSIYGCQQYGNKVDGNKVARAKLDAERGTYVAPTNEDNANVHNTMTRPGLHEEHYIREKAGFWGYVFQIIYQTSAGAVMLTDFVFWLVLFPILAIKDYDINFVLAGMHSLNAVLLLGDTAMNSLRFPWFRMAYFMLWTSIYIIFQWVLHACVSIWWPYPFFDLSTSTAPILYLVLAVLHVPCYTVFALFIKLKHFVLLRWFPQSYRYYIK